MIIAIAIIAYLFWSDLVSLFNAPGQNISETDDHEEIEDSTANISDWGVGEEVFISANGVNVRTGPGTSYDSLGSFDTGFFVGTFNTIKDNVWIEVTPAPYFAVLASQVYVNANYASNG